MKTVRNSARRWFPRRVRRAISRIFRWPPLGLARMGILLRNKPVSRDWGYERGLPIDRYYIERFLAANAGDIRGRVLEIKEDLYTSRFGGAQVQQIDILTKRPVNSKATIIADLTDAPEIPEASFDCIVFTQTLQFIFDVSAALRTLHRILKPGGILLFTVSTISQISPYDRDQWGDYWRFTSQAVQNLLEKDFPAENITINVYGNLKASVGLLSGLAAGEFFRSELDHRDPLYELLVAARVMKPVN